MIGTSIHIVRPLAKTPERSKQNMPTTQVLNPKPRATKKCVFGGQCLERTSPNPVILGSIIVLAHSQAGLLPGLGVGIRDLEFWVAVWVTFAFLEHTQSYYDKRCDFFRQSACEP